MRNNAWVALAIVAFIIGFSMVMAANAAFTTIVTPDGNELEATTGDTLTFAEGTNITITGNPANDTITISATGSAGADITAVGDCTSGECFTNPTTGSGTSLTFLPDSSVSYQEGRIFYNPDTNTFVAFNDEADVAVNIGEEVLVRGRNNTGSTITNGQVVYVTGAVGSLPTFGLAQADDVDTSKVLAVATHDIENNTNGYAVSIGVMRNLDTSAFVDGDNVYLSSTVAGAVTTTRSLSPDYDVFIGTVLLADPTLGLIHVDTRSPDSRTDCSATNQALTFNTTTEVQGCNTFIFGVNVQENGVGVVTDAPVLNFLDPFDVTDVAGDARISWDSAEINDTTWGNNTATIIDWGFNPTGATNPVMRVRDGEFDFDTITTFTIDGTLNANLPDDNVWIGNAAGKSTETAWPDCDLNFQATTYSTSSNAIGCQFIPGIRKVAQVAATTWVIPGYTCRQTADPAQGAQQNNIQYGLIVPPETHTFTGIGINVTSAGTGAEVARLGIYNADTTANGYTPGSLLLDAGTVDITTTGEKIIAISQELEQGRSYFTAFVHDASSLGLTRCNANLMYTSPVQGRSGTIAGSLVNAALRATGTGVGAFTDPATAPDSDPDIVEATFIKLRE